MAFQSPPVLQFQGFGLPGELYNNDPVEAQSWIINSASAAYNIIGATAFTVTSQGVAAAGGSGVFAGILVNPKQHTSFGTSLGTLQPTMTLPNYTQADLLTMGTIIVTLTTTAAIGDVVIYDTTTGALSTIAPGAALPVGKKFANAHVTYYTATVAGLAVITVNPTYVIPS